MKKLNTFIENLGNLEFGSYILFQEYNSHKKVSKPILAIYLGYFAADQTVGFDYVKWNNETRDKVNKVQSHIEWDDYVDILGIWKNKPSWKEIIVDYRKQNIEETFDPKNIIFE